MSNKLTAIALVALVAGLSLSFSDAAQAKDRWGVHVSPYGTSFHYRTGGAHFGFSTGPVYRPYGHGYGYVEPIIPWRHTWSVEGYRSYYPPAYVAPPVIVERPVIVHRHYHYRAPEPTYGMHNGFGGYHAYTYGATIK